MSLIGGPFVVVVPTTIAAGPDTALTPPGHPGRHGIIGRVQIGILGTFEVRADDGVVADVPGARLRGLLIGLGLEPGRVVPKATLVDWIWGENPPADAANALQRLASRLRKALPGGGIEGQTGGYRLAIGADAIDALRFEHLIDQARPVEGPARVRLLREGLALWRG